jgi:hypothetical protein
VVAALALAGAGFASGWILRDDDEAVETSVTTGGSEAQAAPGGLPAVVERKRLAILAAAESGDYDAVADLADPDEFRYTFGSAVAGGPAEYWRQVASDTPDRPLETLAAILKLPYTLYRGIYTWPFAFDKTPEELTDYERGLLEPLGRAGVFVGESYFGWRAGIRPDGSWIFFIAGD